MDDYAFGMLRGGSVAFDLVVIGARFFGAISLGLIFCSSSGATFNLPLKDGSVGSGTIDCLFLPTSGIGFMFTTAVTIAGAGRFEFRPFVGPGMTNVACVDGCGMIDLGGASTGVSCWRGLLAPLFFFLRKSRFNFPVFASFSNFESAITSFNCRSSYLSSLSSYWFLLSLV